MKKSMKNRVAGAAAVLLAGSMAFSMTGCGSSSAPRYCVMKMLDNE